jgi:hypothetical protein
MEPVGVLNESFADAFEWIDRDDWITGYIKPEFFPSASVKEFTKSKRRISQAHVYQTD